MGWFYAIAVGVAVILFIFFAMFGAYFAFKDRIDMFFVKRREKKEAVKTKMKEWCALAYKHKMNSDQLALKLRERRVSRKIAKEILKKYGTFLVSIKATASAHSLNSVSKLSSKHKNTDVRRQKK